MEFHRYLRRTNRRRVLQLAWSADGRAVPALQLEPVAAQRDVLGQACAYLGDLNPEQRSECLPPSPWPATSRRAP